MIHRIDHVPSSGRSATALGRRLRHVLGLPRRRPWSFWLPLLLVAIVGATAGVMHSVSYKATAKVIRRLNPDVAGRLWTQRAVELELPEAAIREKLLSTDNLLAAIHDAHAAHRQRWITTLAAVPPVEDSVRQLRESAHVRVSRLDDALSVISIEHETTLSGGAATIVDTLARRCVAQLRSAHETDLDQVRQRAAGEALALQERIQQLTAVRRRIQLEHDLQLLEPQLESLQDRRAQLSAKAATIDELPQASGTVAQKWQPIVDLERELSQMNLSSSERKRMARHLEQLRRNAAKTPSEPNDAAPPASLLAPNPIANQLAELETELATCESKVRQCRTELASLAPIALDPGNLGRTVPALDLQIAESRKRVAELQTTADRLERAAADGSAISAIDYDLKPAATQIRADSLRLGSFLLATLAFAVAAGLAVARLVDGADTSFHSVEEAREHLHISILGAVPVSHATRPKT